MSRRTRFRQWRGGRPFAGGVLLTVGGAEILVTMKAPLPVIMHIGMQGLAGYLLPVLMAVCGLLLLFNPAQRLFYSVLGILLSLGTWMTSNLGGFFIGLLLGATGSCMAFGWLPDQEPRTGRRHRGRAAREAARGRSRETREPAGEAAAAGESFESAVPGAAGAV
jgi:uncharacterized protein DUF6114